MLDKRVCINANAAYLFNQHYGINVTVGGVFKCGAGADFDTIALGYRFAWGRM